MDTVNEKTDSTRKPFFISMKEAPFGSQLFLILGSAMLAVGATIGFFLKTNMLTAQGTISDILIGACILGVICGFVIMLMAASIMNSYCSGMWTYLNNAWETLQAEWDQRFGNITFLPEDIDVENKKLVLYREVDTGQIYARGTIKSEHEDLTLHPIPLDGGSDLKITCSEDTKVPHVRIYYRDIKRAGEIPTGLLVRPDYFLGFTRLDAAKLALSIDSNLIRNVSRTWLCAHLYLPKDPKWWIEKKPFRLESSGPTAPPTGSAPDEDEETSSTTPDLAAPDGPPTADPSDPSDAPTPEGERDMLDFPSGTPTVDTSDREEAQDGLMGHHMRQNCGS